LPALAPEIAPDTLGKGRRKKRMQQRHAQAITNHARRNEGNRRAAIFERLKKDAMYDKVRDVYRDYAELLHREAQGPQAAATGSSAKVDNNGTAGN
jgi:hypothetical protein